MVAYFCPLHARKIMSTCNIIMLTYDLFMSTCNIIMLTCRLSIFVKNYFFLRVNFLTNAIIWHYTCNMQHNYVHMRLIYVNMQHNYVNMRLIYVIMQHNYVHMRLFKSACNIIMSTCDLVMATCNIIMFTCDLYINNNVVATLTSLSGVGWRPVKM